ncbi:MAG: hypothetical protein NZ561_06080, partial [Phycisphaerae bacterium]|nr:hypothetical protein [Phycisphaerae bacterium]
SALSPFGGRGSATCGPGGGGGDSSIGPGYRRRVRVEGRTSPQVSAGALEAPKFARVEVQVTSPRGRSISLERWMAHYVLN